MLGSRLYFILMSSSGVAYTRVVTIQNRVSIIHPNNIYSFLQNLLQVVHKFFLQATANLVPLSAARVAVKFDSFKIAGVVSEILLSLKCCRLLLFFMHKLQVIDCSSCYLCTLSRTLMHNFLISLPHTGAIVEQFNFVAMFLIWKLTPAETSINLYFQLID